MKIIQSKLERQLSGLDKWKACKGIGRGIYPTGFGKTFMILLTVNKFHAKHPNSNALIICNNSASSNNMYTALNNLKDHLDDIIRANLIISTKDKMIKDNFKSFSSAITPLVIVDEIHEFVSPEAYRLIADKLRYKFFLGMTGTDVSGKDATKLNKICPVFDEVSYEEAIEAGWISKMIEYNFGITLPRKDRDIYDRYSEVITNGNKMSGFNYSLMKQLGKGEYNKLEKRWISGEEYCAKYAEIKGWHNEIDTSIPYWEDFDKVWNPSAIHDAAKKYLHFVEKRNELMNEHPLKIKTVVELAKLFIPKKTIIFNNSIEFIDIVTVAINFDARINEFDSLVKIKASLPTKRDVVSPRAVRVHSKLKSVPILGQGGFIRYKNGKIKQFGAAAQKTLAIKRITDGTSTIIAAVKSLDTAFNIEDLEICIISGGTNNPMQQKQRKGRVLRISEYKQLAKVINVYFKDTRDEAKLLERQKNTTSEIIEINSINQLMN